MRSYVVLIIAVLCVHGAERKPPLSVCDLITHRNEYNGKMVTVRGIVKGVEGAWLVASPDCEYKLVTRGVLWPNIIFLVYPNNRSKIEADHASFKVDWEAVRKAEAAAIQSGYDPHTDEEMATYLGLFVTYQDLDRRVSPGVPGALRLGLGPLGEAPAQLVIKSIKDIVIIHGSGETR